MKLLPPLLRESHRLETYGAQETNSLTLLSTVLEADSSKALGLDFSGFGYPVPVGEVASSSVRPSSTLLSSERRLNLASDFPLLLILQKLLVPLAAQQTSVHLLDEDGGVFPHDLHAVSKGLLVAEELHCEAFPLLKGHALFSEGLRWVFFGGGLLGGVIRRVRVVWIFSPPDVSYTPKPFLDDPAKSA